jgi:hypothetical protein
MPQASSDILRLFTSERILLSSRLRMQTEVCIIAGVQYALTFKAIRYPSNGNNESKNTMETLSKVAFIDIFYALFRCRKLRLTTVGDPPR